MCFIPLFSVGVYQLTWIAWSVLSPAFIPCIVGGLYWKRGTREGAIAAMLVGSVTGFFWYYLLQESTHIHTFFAALVLAILAYIIVSLLTKRPPIEVANMCEYAKKFDDVEFPEAEAAAGTGTEAGERVEAIHTAEAGVRMSAAQFMAVIGQAADAAQIPAAELNGAV
jgi:Na+/proline symporter